MSATTIGRSGMLVLIAAAVASSWIADVQTQERQSATKAAEPAKPYTPARRPDGQPNIEGRWRASPTGTFDLTDPKTGGGRIQELLDVAAGKGRKVFPSRIIDPTDGQIPYRPEARIRQQEIAKYNEAPTKPEHVDPQTRCLPGAVPRSFFHSENMIVQPSGYVVFLTANNHASRVIPLDGRPFLSDDVKLWMGDSRGHWEGNTLVVEVRNQNAKGRFDMVGNFSSDKVRIVERWTIVNENTLNYRATVEDPSVYTRPWTIAAQAIKQPKSDEPYGDEFWEDACHEGERSADHLLLPQEPPQG